MDMFYFAFDLTKKNVVHGTTESTCERLLHSIVVGCSASSFAPQTLSHEALTASQSRAPFRQYLGILGDLKMIYF